MSRHVTRVTLEWLTGIVVANRPANMIWGPARAARYSCGDLAPAAARNTMIIFEAQARPEPAAGSVAQKQPYYYCIRILVWPFSCYDHNHMHFQCVGEV